LVIKTINYHQPYHHPLHNYQIGTAENIIHMCQYTEVLLDINFWQYNQITLDITKWLDKCKH